MERMRDLLKHNLGRSLSGLSVADRLAAAWAVACGPAMAKRGEIVGFTDGIVEVQVEDSAWLDQMRSMGGVLERELARIAGVKVDGIHFQVRGSRPKGSR